MKSVLSLLVLSIAFLSLKGEACSPPMNTLVKQLPELKHINESKDVYKKVLELGSQEPSAKFSKGISRIEYNKGIYTVVTLENCSFNIRVKYNPPVAVGMCPQFGGLELSEGNCPENE